MKLKHQLQCNDILLVVSALTKTGRSYSRQIFCSFEEKIIADAPLLSISDLSQLVHLYVESADSINVSFIKAMLLSVKLSDIKKGQFRDWKHLLSVIQKSGVTDRELLKQCCEALAGKVEDISVYDAMELLNCLLALNVNHHGLIAAITQRVNTMPGDVSAVRNLLLKFTR